MELIFFLTLTDSFAIPYKEIFSWNLYGTYHLPTSLAPVLNMVEVNK